MQGRGGGREMKGKPKSNGGAARDSDVDGYSCHGVLPLLAVRWEWAKVRNPKALLAFFFSSCLPDSSYLSSSFLLLIDPVAMPGPLPIRNR
jgi:hypothetical protein